MLDDHAEIDSPYPDDHDRYGRNNYPDNSQFQPPAYQPPPYQSSAYGDPQHRLPAREPAAAPTMDYGRHNYPRPWYQKKRTWAALLALVVILVIVIPVAVVVTRNKNRANSYPDYSAVNYTLLETCKIPGSRTSSDCPQANGIKRLGPDILRQLQLLHRL